MEKLKCDRCGKEVLNYYHTSDDKIYCMDCMADLIKKEMRKKGKIELYLNTYSRDWYLSDWIGKLHFTVLRRQIVSKKTGRYKRIRKVWFWFEGQWWMGIQKGSVSDTCQCKRLTDDSEWKEWKRKVANDKE